MAEETNMTEEVKETTEVVETPAEEVKAVATAPAEEKKVFKRILQGKVTSNKTDKTITVLTERQIAHPIYKKYYKVSKKMLAHDENNDCNEGDIVRIKEHRPLSKRKRWVLVNIVERAK